MPEPDAEAQAQHGLPTSLMCERRVKPLQEAGAAWLQVAVRVVYLDRSLNVMAGGFGDGDSSAQVNHHDFIPETAPSATAASQPIVPRVHLLYRPGHYDILYPI